MMHDAALAPDVPQTVRSRLVLLSDYLESVWGDRPLWNSRDGALVGRFSLSVRDDEGGYHFPLETIR